MTRTTLLGIAAVAAAIPAFAAPLNSGLKPGERVSPFNPKHVAGPLAGTTNCFPCTFQNRPQVQVWVNGDAKSAAPLAASLSKAMKANKDKEFKALVVFLTTPKNAASTEQFVAKLAKDPSVEGVGMALLDSENEATQAYKVNTSADVKNTVLAYRNWEVKQSFVNLKADAAGLAQLNQAVAAVTK